MFKEVYMDRLVVLKDMLTGIHDSYYDFVDGILAYAEKNESRQNAVYDFIDRNPDVSSSDVVYFVSCQPDFYDDMAPEDKVFIKPETVM